MSRSENLAIVNTILPLLEGKNAFDTPSKSLSPFYSDVGLTLNPAKGVEALCLHYNRKTAELGKPFLALPGKNLSSHAGPLSFSWAGKEEFHGLCFYDTNAWILQSARSSSVVMDLGMLVFEIRDREVDGCRLSHGYHPTLDPRDPDFHFPFLLGLLPLAGSIRNDAMKGRAILEPDKEGNLLVAFAIQLLELDEKKLVESLHGAPETLTDAQQLSRRWFARALGPWMPASQAGPDLEVEAKAAYGLAMNCARSPGLPAGRISAFPSRGGYPVHFLWDSCFQNLGYEMMQPGLAEDSLLLLTENMRPDGKMPHFICSTWVRPKDSQPPLVGWAARRLVGEDDRELARKLLHPLIRNSRWWLSQRMSASGLLFCPHPMETGWDDTPRMDSGPILAVDMNVYLILQLEACTYLARVCDEMDAVADFSRVAFDLTEKLIQLLYDPEQNIFLDAEVVSGRRNPLKTPAGFLPLLVDLPLEEGLQKKMIEDWLLQPDHFFGEVPFPSVAYSESVYESGKWWRGPTWLPIAYLMLEVLERHGFHRASREAAERLHGIVVRDGMLHELFDSRTGKGIGNAQQGWSAAIYLKLCQMLA